MQTWGQLTEVTVGRAGVLPARRRGGRFAHRSLCGLCAALLPPEEGGPHPEALGAELEWFLSKQPDLVALGARLGAVGIDGLSRALTGSSLLRLSPERRSSVLDRLVSTSVGSQALTGLKALVLIVSGAAAFEEETLERGREVPPARLDAEIDVVASMAWPTKSRADVIVVGSGAGGAMIARTLARAGRSVVVVEEGRRHGVDEFRNGRPIERFADLYRDGGSTAALGQPPVALPIGRAVGGTTVVNSGTCYRTPEKVLKRWREEMGLTMADPASFGTYLDEVEATLQVAPAPMDVLGKNGEMTLLGAERLGWRSGPLRRNAPGCAGRCQCAIGCPRNAKFGVHLNALPQASAAGARVVSEARVDRVLIEDGTAAGVQARRPDGSTFVISASTVVIAAGATETPTLLRRSGIAGHPAIGRNLALHPAVGVAGRFDEEITSWRGVLQSAGIEEFHESEGILIEATATPPGMGSMVLPGHGKELLREIERADHLVTVGAMIGDESNGRVYGAKRTVIRYDLSQSDARKLLKAIEVVARVLFSAGATEVMTGIGSVPVLRSASSIAEELAVARPSELHLAAFHPTGTVAAGGNASRHPVTPEGRLRTTRGVWVADASLLPSCPEVNPQLTIMAMALAVGDAMVAGS